MRFLIQVMCRSIPLLPAAPAVCYDPSRSASLLLRLPLYMRSPSLFPLFSFSAIAVRPCVRVAINKCIPNKE
jgi:hypothetical protein